MVQAAGDGDHPSLHRPANDVPQVVGVWLLRLPAGHHLDPDHRAQATDVADLRHVLGNLFPSRPDRLADLLGPLDQALLLDHLQDGVRRRARHRVTDVRAPDGRRSRRVHHVGPPHHRRERIARSQGLGQEHQVGFESEMLRRQERAGSTAPRLHLVGDQEDAVPPAPLGQALQELRGRHDEPAFALDGFHDRCRHAVRIDDGDERSIDRLQSDPPGVVGMRAPVRIGIRQPVDLGREWTEAGLVGVVPARERHRQQRAAVEPALEAQDGRPTRRGAGELHGVLDCLRSRVEQRYLPLATAGQGHQALRQLDKRLVRDHREVGVRDLRRLALNGLHRLRVRIANQLTPETTREVEELVPVDVGHDRAPAMIDNGRGMDVQRIAHDLRLALQDR